MLAPPFFPASPSDFLEDLSISMVLFPLKSWNHAKSLQKNSGHPNNLSQHKPTNPPFEVKHRDVCCPSLQFQGISPHLCPGSVERSPPGWDSRQHQQPGQSTWHQAFPPRWRSQQIAHSFQEPAPPAPGAPRDPETRFAPGCVQHVQASGVNV